jgi:hypothetical protein
LIEKGIGSRRSPKVGGLFRETCWPGVHGKSGGGVCGPRRSHVFVIDAGGVIRYKGEGADEEMVDQVVEKLLKETGSR